MLALLIITTGKVEVSAKVCSFWQEPHPSHGHKLHWVMAGSKDERCLCAVILPGGINTMATKTPYELYYTDQPLFTDDVQMIHDYFDCHDGSLTPTMKTIIGKYFLPGVGLVMVDELVIYCAMSVYYRLCKCCANELFSLLLFVLTC